MTRSLNDRISAKAIERRLPFSGTFELSPLCNLSCGMCYVRQTSVQVKACGGIRPASWWLSLAEQCTAEGMLNLLLTGGEPFLYPEFQELLTALDRMGLQISINTNGTCIDERAIEWLVKAPPSKINITLYGGSPETYEHQCGDASAFERVLHAADLLTEAHLRFRFNCSLAPQNAEDLDAVLALAKGYKESVKVTAYMFPPIRLTGKSGINEGRLSPEEAAYYEARLSYTQSTPEWFRRVAENAMKYKDLTEEEIKKAEASPPGEMRCLSGRCSFWVDWQGNLSGCGANDHPKWSLDEMPFADAWHALSDYTEHFRYSPACTNCINKQVCTSCAAMVYNETGGYEDRPVYLCEKAKYAAKWYGIFLKEMDREGAACPEVPADSAPECPFDEM